MAPPGCVARRVGVGYARRWRADPHSRMRRGDLRTSVENEAPVADEAFQPNSQEDGVDSAEHARVTEDPRYEGATPPGYDWPTHGGYLGCLLAVMFACLLAPLGYIVVGFLGAFLAQPLGTLGVGIAVAVTVIGYVALFVLLARLGW